MNSAMSPRLSIVMSLKKGRGFEQDILMQPNIYLPEEGGEVFAGEEVVSKENEETICHYEQFFYELT
jgi:hypothetical protein